MILHTQVVRRNHRRSINLAKLRIYDLPYPKVSNSPKQAETPLQRVNFSNYSIFRRTSSQDSQATEPFPSSFLSLSLSLSFFFFLLNQDGSTRWLSENFRSTGGTEELKIIRGVSFEIHWRRRWQRGSRKTERERERDAFSQLT